MPIFTLDIGPLTLAPTWYGLMYAISFYVFFLVLRNQKMTEKHIDTILIFTIFGVILGGRLGYVFLYNFSYYWEHIGEIFMPWKGGMSFHGGALGVIFAWYLASRKLHISFLYLADKLVWFVPFALMLGRIGNYINGELFGVPEYVGIGAKNIDGISYFPTPLFEALFEGLVLGCILFWKRNTVIYPGQLGVWFLGGYGCVRFIAEFLRMPDAHIGYMFSNWMTLGHIFSLLMIFVSMMLHFLLRNSTIKV